MKRQMKKLLPQADENRRCRDEKEKPDGFSAKTACGASGTLLFTPQKPASLTVWLFFLVKAGQGG